MRLGTKFLALLLCTIITPIIIVVGITYSTINKSITQIESDKGEQNVTNTIKYMESLVNSQKNSMYSWLPWTDLYTAVNDKNITWLKENVLISEKDNTQNEVLLILDKNFNPIAFSDKAPKEWHNTNLKNLSVVKELNSTTPFASDVLLTKNSAFIIAIGKICVNEDTKFQNPNGYIITAQKITPTLISTGANIINAHITLKFNNGYIVSSTDNPDTNKHASTTIEANNKTMIIDAERSYTNSLNEPIGVLHIETTSSTGLNALSTLTTASISLILIILVLSIITFLWLKYKVTTPINNVINIINQKDLSQRVNVSGKDEISILAKAFNGFTHSLKANFKNVKCSVDEVKTISSDFIDIHHESTLSMDQISHSIENSTTLLNSNILELKNISSTVGDITYSSGEILETLDILKKNSQNINQSAKKGMDSIDSMSNVISETEVKFEDNFSTINNLVKSIETIHGFTKLINDISSQSNLLALNASIEASKAGDAGLGFAVVSEEVRKLSVETEEVVKKMNSVIEEILSNAKKSTNSSIIVKKQLESAELITNRTHGEISLIISTILSITKSIGNISSKFEIQSSQLKDLLEMVDIINNSFEKVNTNFKEVKSATSSQLQISESLSEKSQELNSTIDDLNEVVNQFKGL